ncbi:MAG: hypothetical protein AAGC64_13155 [Bacteroidota bacterium]
MNTQKPIPDSRVKPLLPLILILLSTFSFAFYNDNDQGDTVIIELSNQSKIVIITQNKADLATLQNYDINQMIRDLNEQLSDSVKYMEIKDGKAYVNENSEIEMKDWEINDDKVRVKLGGIEVDVDPDEIEDWDNDDWEDRRKVTYDAKRVDRTSHHFNIDLGINNWLEDGQFPDENNAPYSVKPFGSWYVALNSVNKTWVGGPLFLEWGLGVSWYNWKLQDPDFVIVEGVEAIEFNPAPQGLNGSKSKLTASFVNVHIVPMFDFSRGIRKVTSYESSGVRIKRYSKKGFRFGLGGYAGYRLGSHTKFKFEEDGNTEKDKESDNFYLQNFRYGLRGQVGWKGLEIFVLYDLNEVFSEGRGPINRDGQNATLNAITFGVTL